ncbi:MAG: 2-succinyl-5-enolpyruvyl-6-hydroxy-3-cyclohexene-1-carboxylic-acid synthase [Acidimicrobiales bacterium]
MSVPADVQATFAATLVDEWVRCGVTHAVACPGSRSTALALALARASRQGRLCLDVRLDERSAAFFGLGVGLATGRPAVVLTTSGTAAVELHPAVVEAHQGRTPLIVCTADRPPELHHVGAPQTVEQEGLYGGALRWEVAPGVADEATCGTWRSLAARMVAEATGGPGGPGPVHANLAFREPLVGQVGPLPPGRPGGRPWHRVQGPEEAPPPGWLAGAAAGWPGWLAGAAAGWRGRRGLVVVGAGAGDPEAIHALAEVLGWPVLADPRSGARLARATTVAAADALLRCASFAEAHRPEVVLRLGAPWASKVLAGWLGSLDASVEQVMVSPWWTWPDPQRTASTVLRADPTATCQALAAQLAPEPGGVSTSGSGGTGIGGTGTGGLGSVDGGGWLASWAGAEGAAQGAIRAVLARHAEPTEPGVARAVLGALPAAATLVVGSSMPVRDLEWYGAAAQRPPRVLSNRGANGIDGTVSTTLGVAAASPNPTVGLMGDLAFLYDASALLGATQRGLAATVVVVDNDGGGIFSFLPQAGAVDTDAFELLWGTPQPVDLAALASVYGVPVTEARLASDIAPAVADAVASGECRVVRVRTDRQANVAIHDEIHAAVAAALDDLANWGS